MSAGRDQNQQRTAGAQAGRRGGMTTGLLLGVAVAVLALPSAVLALSTRFEPDPSDSENSAISALAAASRSSPLANVAPVRSLTKGHPFRFTPAGTPTRPDRSVTVAVRVDPETAAMITVRGAPIKTAVSGSPQLRIAPTGFNLGVSRGYGSFAQNLLPLPAIRKIEMPDLSAFKPGQAARPAPGRLAPRIALDEREAVGRAPRTFSGDGEDQVEVGGSLRLTRNLDVTAGVRYSQERERLRPLTDGKQDNQAVYVGTQFRF
jgi:hypothetical protein